MARWVRDCLLSAVCWIVLPDTSRVLVLNIVLRMVHVSWLFTYFPQECRRRYSRVQNLLQTCGRHRNGCQSVYFLQDSGMCFVSDVTLYSKTCLSWPPTVPEKVDNINKWSTYTSVPQNRQLSAILIFYFLLNIQSVIYFNVFKLLQHLKIWRHTWIIKIN
jgi:hypothetical protein